MKRIMSVLVLVIAVITLASCGKSDEEIAREKAEEAAAKALEQSQQAIDDLNSKFGK